MILSLYASCSSNFQLVFKRNPLLHQFFSSLLSSISLGKSRHLKPIELKFCASLRFVGGAARVISTSGTLRATFVSEYVWPKTSKSHVTRLQWSRSLFAVHVWTLDKAVSGCGTPSTLFSFLFKSSHVRPINICEVKYFLYNQSVWEVRKLRKLLCLKPRTSILCVIQVGGAHVDCFFLKWKRTSVWKAKNLETSSF